MSEENRKESLEKIIRAILGGEAADITAPPEASPDMPAPPNPEAVIASGRIGTERGRWKYADASRCSLRPLSEPRISQAIHFLEVKTWNRLPQLFGRGGWTC